MQINLLLPKFVVALLSRSNASRCVPSNISKSQTVIPLSACVFKLHQIGIGIDRAHPLPTPPEPEPRLTCA